MKKSKKVISLTEAAKLSEYNQDYLGSLIRKGEIKGEKIGRSYFTTEEEIKNFLFKQKIPDKEIASDKVISLTEAAKLSEYNQDYLGSLIRKGEIKGEKIGRSYFTTEEEIKNFLFKQKIPDKKPTVRDFFSRHYTSTIFVNALTILIGFSLIGFYIWSIGNNKPKISTTTTPDATNIPLPTIVEEIPEPAVIPPAIAKEDTVSPKIIT